MLKGLNEHKERDKITMAEKRLLHRSVHNRYKEVLRDQHLKKNFKAETSKNQINSARSSVKSDGSKSKKSKGEESSDSEEE